LYKDLGALNLMKDTVIAMVGDHGEGLGEHQETTHSVLIYNSTLHVPMFIIAPGKIAAGKQITQLCRTIDLAPTLLDYLGIQNKFGEGVSLRNLIEGKPQKELTAYSESLYPKLNLGWSALTGMESANRHYIESPEPELFEVQKDPSEKMNRIKQFPNVALRHRQELQKFASSGARASLPAEPMDPEMREKLASLGYVSGTSTAPDIESRMDPKQKIGIWNQIQIALYHMSRKEYPVAAEKLKPLLITEKQMPVLYDYLGSAYMQMEDWSNAENIYRQAFQLGIESSMFHTNLGLIHQHRKEYSNAEQELLKAIALDSFNVSAHFHLGNVFRLRGQPEKALKQYETALKINPHYVFALNGAGMVYVTLKQDERALRSFQEAVKIDPRNAPAYFNLAVQLERMKQREASLEAYKQFLSISNDRQFTAQRKKASEAINRLQ
jgi:tetratricopeptide (TPR) repeat protein